MKIKEYELVDHGLDYPDYFQGCGTSFTRFEFVDTGCGMDADEALNDCLEQIAMSHDIDEGDLDVLEQEIKKELILSTEKASEDENSDEQYYLSIRFNLV